jgi:hypothetical protein
LNELATMATRIQGLQPELTPLLLAIELAQVPLGLSGGDYRFPEEALRTLVSTV